MALASEDFVSQLWLLKTLLISCASGKGIKGIMV